MKFTLLLTALFLTFSSMNSTAQGVPAPKNGVVRPQYKITVTQSGKPMGEIVLELFSDVAPKHVANFEKLAASGFYNGTAFHRVIPGFMIQGGDPNSKNKSKDMWGMGDASQEMVPAEFSTITHKRGILSAARRGDNINSATSQFFICVSDAAFLDNQYTVYGQVLSGMDVADKIVNSPRDSRDNPNEKIEMTVTKIATAAKAKSTGKTKVIKPKK